MNVGERAEGVGEKTVQVQEINSMDRYALQLSDVVGMH